MISLPSKAPLTDNEDPVCHLRQLSVTRHEDRLTIQAYADRFLKHMVRAIVGTLVEIGHAKRTPESLRKILARRTERPQAERLRPRAFSSCASTTTPRLILHRPIPRPHNTATDGALRRNALTERKCKRWTSGESDNPAGVCGDCR